MNPFLFRLVLSICFCFFGLSLTAEAQQQDDFKYELKGIVRDQNAAVIPGLFLKTDSNFSSFTDINGEFQFSLPAGDHIITTASIPASKFRAFIKITKTELNPGYLEFVIDSTAIICSGNINNSSPKIISSEQPKYPAAARAIRAGGEVAVALLIAQNGDVSTAKAVRGHPLLKAAAVTAAKNFKFESSETTAEREIQLIFVFLPEQTEKPSLKRYQCPYRIIIAPEYLPIDISNTHTN